MDPKATAGRIVHYHEMVGDFLAPARAAIINVDTTDDGVAIELTVFAPTGPRPLASVLHSKEPRAGCWSWMPYQQEKAKTAAGNVSESAEPRPPTTGEAQSKPQPPFSG